jgi:hypothetical protein
MRARLKPVWFYTIGLLALALGLSFGTTAKLQPPPAHAITVVGPAAVPDLSGTWEGSWSDTRYSVSGSMSLVIALNGADYSATGSIDISEIDLLLGQLNGTATGTISGNTMSFSFSATNLGTGTGTFTDGGATGTGTVTAPLGFGAFEFSGTVTGGQMDGTFNFTSPTGGNGVASLSRSVAGDEANWTEIKASYR